MSLPPSLRCFQVLALAAALAAGGGAQAQSLLQLYDTAHGYDAAYQSALAQAQARQARADQARAGLLPQVGLQAGAQRNWAETSVLDNRGSRVFNVLNAAVSARSRCTGPPTASPGTRAGARPRRRRSTWPAPGKT